MENLENLNTTEIEERSPFLLIWFWPRKAVRRILEIGPEKHLILIILLGGLADLIGVISDTLQKPSPNLIFNILVEILVGPFLLVLVFYLSAWLLYWISRKLGGKGLVEEVRAVFAWSNLVQLLLLPLEAIYLFGLILQNFSSPDLEVFFQALMAMFSILILLVSIIVFFWNIVVVVIGLSEVSGFSKKKAFLSLILWFGLILIPVFGCVFSLGLLG